LAMEPDLPKALLELGHGAPRPSPKCRRLSSAMEPPATGEMHWGTGERRERYVWERERDEREMLLGRGREKREMHRERERCMGAGCQDASGGKKKEKVKKLRMRLSRWVPPVT
jgi:hypothetical protein